MGVYQWSQAPDANALLARVFGALRATQSLQRPGEASPHFFASNDDLHQRIVLPEWQALVGFIVEGLRDTVMAANGGWQDAQGQSPAFQIALEGLWFQISNRGVHHDIHTHGNCSWSGVYYVQIDPLPQRSAHPDLGALNGATRFYSPMFPLLGGAHMDMGNAFMQNATLDVTPEAGELVLFPAFLPHKAMPYQGAQDRIIVSFNAQIRAPGGNQIYPYAAV
jgi:uncharacterized protein (TIGR02466 family)